VEYLKKVLEPEITAYKKGKQQVFHDP